MDSSVCLLCLVMPRVVLSCFVFLMKRRPPRSTLDRSSAASDVYKRQMIFPAVIMAARLLVVLGGPLVGLAPSMTMEGVMLRATFDAIYIGVSVWLHQRADTPWTGPRQLLDPREALGIFGIVLWLAAPFAAPELVPRSLAGVTWLHIVFGFAGLVVATWPVLVTKNQWPSLGIIHERQPLAPPTRVPPKSTDRWIDRLRGMSRLLPGQLASAVVIALLSLRLL